IDPLTVFHAARGRVRTFWSIPDAGVTLAAVGEAFAATATSPHDRFAEVSAELGGLDLQVEGDAGPAEAGPLLLGGFAFSDDDIGRPPDWSAFGAARLVLPEILVANTPEGTFLTTVGDADTSGLLDGTVLPTDLGSIVAVDHRVDDDYEALVEHALSSIDSDELQKVVTARRLHLASHLDLTVLLDRLRHRFENCATFAFDTGDRVFLGASPEQLVARRSSRVDTMAVAGTRPRHDHPGLDAQLRASLLASPKERLEHQMVVDDIRATLRNAGVDLDADAETGVLRLRRNQHLFTPIGGSLTAAASTLDLVAALHPTPAVAGLPRRAAQDWIDHHESFERGWYAAPVGWTTVDGTGEFRVALRSALLDSDGITLFAGGGIVDGSVPSQELAETAVKLEALLGALGLTE
ncbi:MAG: isochorismate synthase, partial [Actinomycetota bacterium]|nr:isochorismate synthase [Actinomycetota bacterium]